jgi:hypothetical protein
MTFLSLACRKLYRSILADFLGRHNENTCESRVKESHP